MKIKLIILIHVLIIAAAQGLFGFVENRHQWWEIRLQKLSTEKEKIQKNRDIDPRVTGLLESEIVRARDILSIFESDLKGNGALTHVAHQITENEIAGEARAVAPPLFSIYLLESMTGETGTGIPINEARNAAQENLYNLVRSALGSESNPLVEKIMKEDISHDDWKNISLELFTGRLMESRKELEEKMVSGVGAAVLKKLRESGSTANARELRAMTLQASLEYLREFNINRHLPGPGHALDLSWSWKMIRTDIERELGAYRSISAMLAGAGDLSPERIRTYYRNSAEFESLLFKGRRDRIMIGTAAGAAKIAAPGRDAMDIPGQPKMILLLDEMDRLRKSALQTVTGREDRKFLDSIGNNLSAVITRHTEETRNAFFREEERVRMIRAKGGDQRALKGEADFREAKKAFLHSLDLLKEYRDRSVRFIDFASKSKRISVESIVGRYRYQIQRQGEYLSFLKELVSGCASLSTLNDRQAHKKFRIAYGRSGSLFKYVGASLGIDKIYLPHLSRSDIATIRELKAEFLGTMHALKSDMRNAYDDYSMKKILSEGTARKSGTDIKEKIAQQEIDTQFRYARECVSLYGAFHYADEAFIRYLDRFNGFVNQAKNGDLSSRMEYTVKMNSLIPAVENFDAARIGRELATKKYLHSEARTALSRLITLIHFYKKNHVEVKDVPAAEEITALEARLRGPAQVKIDSWLMNETNFMEIDRKAMKKLSLIMYRKSMDRSKGGSTEKKPEAHSGRTVTIDEPALSLSLPRGWEEDPDDVAGGGPGMTRTFRGNDADTSILLVKLPLENGDVKSVSERWIEKSGNSLVEKRWEKAGGLEYLWILARDKNRNIIETCSVSKDGFAFLISGKTSRTNYYKFKNQFRQVVGSLKVNKI